MLKHFKQILIAIACAGLLSSCFIPDQYETEIRLSKDGSHGVSFNGILIYAPLYGQIARGKIDEAHAKDNDRMMFEQLKRDTDFKEVTPLGKGRYRVKYERTGRFAGTHQMVTFVSRQEPIFRALTTESGNIEVNGSGRARTYAKSLDEVGIKSAGLFRITTDMQVIEQNAQTQRKSVAAGYTQFDWRRRSLSEPPPRFVAKLAVDPRTGVPAYSGSAVNVEPEIEKK